MGDIDQTFLGLSTLCSLHQLDSLCKSYLSFVQSDLRIHSQKLFFKIANNCIYSRKLTKPKQRCDKRRKRFNKNKEMLLNTEEVLEVFAFLFRFYDLQGRIQDSPLGGAQF